jgi:hypothetical protein
MTKTVIRFLAGALVGWLAVAAFAFVRWDVGGLICALTTGLVCLIPTTIALIANLWAAGRSSQEQLLAVMGGMGLKMMVVLAVSVALFLSVPFFRAEPSREYAFWGSLLLCYLFALAWETVLVSRNNRAADTEPAVR